MNVNLEVAHVTTPLVAIGEVQKRGMTGVIGPHGSFVTRGHVTKPPGGSLELEHSNGACWVRLLRGDIGTRILAPVEMGDSMPTMKAMSDLLSVEGTIDTMRKQKHRSGGPTEHPRIECGFMFLASRVHIVNPGLTTFNMID